jgi:hypothetical protein
MNIKKLFGGSEPITSQERQKLEALDSSCKELKDWLLRLPGRIPANAEERHRRLLTVAEEFAKRPSEEAFAKVTAAAAMTKGGEDFEAVASCISREIEARMAPQAGIVAGILKRHLATLERQYEQTFEKEQKESQEFGIQFRPSGIIRGLEEKILELRNRIHAGDSRPWREALKELL